MYRRLLLFVMFMFICASTPPIEAQQSEATRRLLERNKMFKPNPGPMYIPYVALPADPHATGLPV